MQDGSRFTIALDRDLATERCLLVSRYTMPISLLSLPLRYFLEVARTGSVNQAAQRLYVAASAVSRQLGKLEDSLGVVLFERQARGMTLTEAGTRLLAHASAHDAQALELVDKLRREQGLTVISAMHDLTLAGMYADRLVLMHQGARVAEGSAKEVLQPNILSEFYGVSARVHHEDDGTVVVIPQRISTR